jgi:hypothetical protein
MRAYRMIFVLLTGPLVVTVSHGAACELPDNGTVTVAPPPACPQRQAGHMSIIDAFRAYQNRDWCRAAGLHRRRQVTRRRAGWWNSDLERQLQSVDDRDRLLAGRVRPAVVPVFGEIRSAPCVLRQPGQSSRPTCTECKGRSPGTRIPICS